MDLRDELLKRVERKQQEIQELQLKIREATAYMQGLQETIKLLPRESSGVSEVSLRAGTSVFKAREAIRSAGKPLHINEILKAIGKPVEKYSKAGMSGSLAAYVRKGEIFTRPFPNTFGLFEFSRNHQQTRIAEEPPATFGVMEDEETETATT